jgi:undecaprenyl-diphosphatase
MRVAGWALLVVCAWVLAAEVGGPAAAASPAASAVGVAAVTPAAHTAAAESVRQVPLGALAAESGDDKGLSLLDALILGVVEGVTEYLPVSSTGHLLVTQQALGIYGNADLETAADAYAICIQFGAIMAVLVLYWGRFVQILRGIIGRDPLGRRLAWALLASFIPAAVLGVLGEQYIKEYLFAIWPIVIAWIVGGIVILVVAHYDTRSGRRSSEGTPMEGLTAKRALVIGLLQCVAMWPGVSRSLATILGGRLVGLSTAAAVEYSFLLGLITLTAATVYSTIKDGAVIVETLGIVAPIVGVIAAFVSAALAVKWMVGYLNRHSLAVFGWYRIGIGIVVAALVLAGVL